MTHKRHMQNPEWATVGTYYFHTKEGYIQSRTYLTLSNAIVERAFGAVDRLWLELDADGGGYFIHRAYGGDGYKCIRTHASGATTLKVARRSLIIEVSQHTFCPVVVDQGCVYVGVPAHAFTPKKGE